jgi:glycosyltransferase involved in cell wall biosynthesis
MEFYRNTPVHLFISTSRSEGVPVSMMEALSFGIPVMATAVGGVPELVSNHVGHLLKINPLPQEVAQAISNFISLPPAEQYVKRQAARTVWEHNWSASTNYPSFCNTLIQL